MAEIPPPPDELPDGISLKGKEETPTLEGHYRRILSIVEDIKDTYQKLLEQRTKLLRDLERIEKLVASAPRIMILGAIGAVMGMAAYHLIMILATKLTQ